VLRYTNFVTIKIVTADYRALAALRYRIRLFLSEGDAAARRLGLEPQQYSLLLAVRGLPDGSEATVQALAERLILKHNSTVELIDRLEMRGYLCRSRSLDDRRYTLVKLLPRGKRILERVARQRLPELRAGGPHWLMHLMRFWDANRNLEERTRAHSMTKRRGAEENREQE
jgi:DNA-binding MarR family transcriptional regulator